MKRMSLFALTTLLCVLAMSPDVTEGGKLKKILGPLSIIGGAAGAGALGGALLSSHKHEPVHHVSVKHVHVHPYVYIIIHIKLLLTLSLLLLSF